MYFFCFQEHDSMLSMNQDFCFGWCSLSWESLLPEWVDIKYSVVDVVVKRKGVWTLSTAIKPHMTQSHDLLSFVNLQVLWFSQPWMVIWISYSLIIMIITCNGCNKTFKNSHGLSCHQTSCLAAKGHTAYLAQKCLNLSKVRNGRKKIPGAVKDTGVDGQQQKDMENVSYAWIY